MRRSADGPTTRAPEPCNRVLSERSCSRTASWLHGQAALHDNGELGSGTGLIIGEFRRALQVFL